VAGIFRGKGWYKSLGEAGAKRVAFEGVEGVSAEYYGFEPLRSFTVELVLPWPRLKDVDYDTFMNNILNSPVSWSVTVGAATNPLPVPAKLLMQKAMPNM
jgi:hypothetical protein